MDAERERIARTPGPGHQLLQGVAGSGKTLCLVARQRHLRGQHPDWRILLLCFNGSLAAWLRQEIGPDPDTDVQTFHGWAHAKLTAGGVAVPDPPGRGALWDRYWTKDVAQLLLAAYEDGRIPSETSQAVLVDEGQDFAGDWYRALLHELDHATGSLLIAVDPAQDIYDRRVRWADIGIRLAGRPGVLRANLRNTRPIVSAAYEIIRGLRGSPETSGPLLGSLAPEPAAGGGPAPEVRRCASFAQSRGHALSWIRDRLARGVPPGDILVLGLSRLDVATVNAWLNSKHIAARMPAETDTAEGVRVSTIHRAKGLEAQSVLLLDAHQLQSREDPEARRLLYIAMTRARRDLCVSYFRPTPLMQELERVCARG
jgi:superfamily I DNA/RNA helicase